MRAHIVGFAAIYFVDLLGVEQHARALVARFYQMLGQIRLQAQHLLLQTHMRPGCKDLGSATDRYWPRYHIASRPPAHSWSAPTRLNDGEQQVLLPALHVVDATDQLLVLLVVGPLRVFLQVSSVHHARHLTRVNEGARPVINANTTRHA